MVIGIGRRQFISMLGTAAAAWPLAASAQQASKVPRIGILGAASSAGFADRVAGFRAGLRDLGYVEGTNVILEFRWAEGNYARLPELAAELIRSNIDLLVTHGTPGSLAAKQATATIPLVIASIGDPVAVGLVASVARPGGNVTGESFFSPEMQAKKIELLKEMMPHVMRVAVLSNPDNSAITGPEFQAVAIAAKSLKVELQEFPVRGPNEFESAFEKMAQQHVEAVEITDDGYFLANSGAIAALAKKWRLLSIGGKEIARAGGVIGYGVDFPAMWRQAAVLVDKILKGAKPADLPFEQATRFTTIVNLKAAKAIGIAVPTSILLRADEVIE
jgi:putative tryptophan/tyrosine transport system substrate-binding protein